MATVQTRKGREILTGRMRGSTPSQAEPLNITWGYNPVPTTAANTDVAMFKEGTESRVAGTSSQVTTTTTNDTYQVVGTITASAAETISEVGLFDATTQPAQASVAAGGVVGSNSSTTLNTSANYSPGNGASIQIRGEVMTVTAGSGTAALTVTRGQNGSAAISTIAVSDAVTAGNIPGSTTTAGGSMFLHGDFTGLALNSGDSITFTIQVSYS